jgi:hypothetical protein
MNTRDDFNFYAAGIYDSAQGFLDIEPLADAQ